MERMAAFHGDGSRGPAALARSRPSPFPGARAALGSRSGARPLMRRRRRCPWRDSSLAGDARADQERPYGQAIDALKSVDRAGEPERDLLRDAYLLLIKAYIFRRAPSTDRWRRARASLSISRRRGRGSRSVCAHPGSATPVPEPEFVVPARDDSSCSPRCAPEIFRIVPGHLARAAGSRSCSTPTRCPRFPTDPR